MSYKRYILGDEIELEVQCLDGSEVAAAPTSAPSAKVYTEAGTLVTTVTMPPKGDQTGLFGYMLPLDSDFTTGRHIVRYSYVVSGSTYAELSTFEIAPGGHASGQIISMAFVDRPDGRDLVLSQVDMGGLNINRKPSV